MHYNSGNKISSAMTKTALRGRLQNYIVSHKWKWKSMNWKTKNLNVSQNAKIFMLFSQPFRHTHKKKKLYDFYLYSGDEVLSKPFDGLTTSVKPTTF